MLYKKLEEFAANYAANKQILSCLTKEEEKSDMHELLKAFNRHGISTEKAFMIMMDAFGHPDEDENDE